jgi:hypothetical protein
MSVYFVIFIFCTVCLFVCSLSFFSIGGNGRGYKQLGTSWTLSYQPSRKLASESDARPTT